MKVRWKKLIANLLFWLAIEIFLNSLGLDTLAAYGEFIFDRQAVVSLAR
jgi:hypothetical protein